MRKLYSILTALIFSLSLVAQTPAKMSYQAVIRSATGVLLPNQAVGIKISILQGTATGTLVFQEIYNPNPQTNANGLVSIEIGGGTPLTGTFAAINWSAGTYFLKTETDPTGGTNYTITGTSQVLSVPYALHAKTGDNVTGIVAIANGGTGAGTVSGAKTGLELGNVDNTTDLLKPVSTATQTALNLKAPLASPAFTGTPLATTAIAGTSTTQIATTEFVTSTINASVPSHYIGESYGGGIVFYVYDNGQHGLIAARENQSEGIHWNNGSNIKTSAYRDGIGAGKFNTDLIIANQGDGNYAAMKCALYQGGSYGDWYLPSRHELRLLYLQKNEVGGFPREEQIFWSSTEISSLNAFVRNFGDGSDANYIKDGIYYARAVRAF